MRLIVGLGNPGKTYQWSKHNMGFLCLDAFAKSKNLTFAKEAKFHGELVKGDDFVLLKPRTYMNLSGQAVRAAADYFKILPADILVVSDDMDIPLFKIRIREQGSAGGHNGLKSIIDHLGTNAFNRLRIGIERPEGMDAKDYVLSNFSKAEKKELESLFALTNGILDQFATNVPVEAIMNQYNRK
jgi:peptidyl-tRNA hydrolase, PTH1 family